MRSAFSFTVYPNRVISEREAALARDAAEAFLRDLVQPAPVVAME